MGSLNISGSYCPLLERLSYQKLFEPLVDLLSLDKDRKNKYNIPHKQVRIALPWCCQNSTSLYLYLDFQQHVRSNKTKLPWYEYILLFDNHRMVKGSRLCLYWCNSLSSTLTHPECLLSFQWMHFIYKLLAPQQQIHKKTSYNLRFRCQTTQEEIHIIAAKRN